MATREENLKKINAELEKLSDEQLEQVAGGIRRLPGPYGPHGPNGPFGPYGPHGPHEPYGPYGSHGPHGPHTLSESQRQ